MHLFLPKKPTFFGPKSDFFLPLNVIFFLPKKVTFFPHGDVGAVEVAFVDDDALGLEGEAVGGYGGVHVAAVAPRIGQNDFFSSDRRAPYAKPRTRCPTPQPRTPASPYILPSGGSAIND